MCCGPGTPDADPKIREKVTKARAHVAGGQWSARPQGDQVLEDLLQRHALVEHAGN
jgi:hypothetical protein